MEAFDVIDFERDVIEQSHEIPVVVDFWAQWCGPCRILGPILEKIAKQSRNWILKKVNVDEFQEISSKYQIKGIPAVKLFKNGKPIAEFTGALPEPQVLSWLNSNMPSESDEKAEQALLFLEMGNPEKAENLLEQVLKEEPNHSMAAYFLGKIKMFEKPEKAIGLFLISEKDPQFIVESGYLKKMAALINLNGQQENFEDHPVKPVFIEAVNALSKQDFNQALERFIEVIIKNKAYENESAREACIAIFNYLGKEHELTKKFRRKFDMALY